MSKKISRKQEIIDRLAKEGKVVRRNTPEDHKMVQEMNERLKVIRRDFQVKERASQVSASKVTLTA